MADKTTDSPTKLSKNVLQMKFMQRSVLRMEEEQNEEERQRAIDDEHWVLDLPELKQREDRFVTEPSYTACENLLFGRMSFQGFNPEVEKLMLIYNKQSELEQSEERENEIGVSPQEMASRYSALVGLIGKKFAIKRNRNELLQENEANDEDDVISEDDDQLINTALSTKKRKKFLKPKDD